MIVNGKGKVVNLYADRAATADNATKLGGLTVAQIKTAAKGATGAPGTPGAKGDPGTPGAKGDPGPRPVSVLWVAPSGGDYPTVSAALAAITDNGPAHPYLIKVAPGTYTETGSVVMKNYVDIEGSGQDMTTITCTCGSTTVPTADGSSAVLQVTGPGVHVWIRNLTITNMGSNLRYSTGVVTRTTDPGDVSLDAMTITATGGDHNYAIVNYSSSSTMTNVTATVTGGTGDSYGIHNFYSNATMTNVTATSTGSAYNYAIYSLQSSPTMTNVTATATGGNIDYGIENNSTVMSMMTHVTATATGGQTANWGILNNGGSSTILDSFVTGSTDSIYTPGGTVRVANTRLSGAVSGAMTCVGAYNATTFLALGTSCV
jgi:pectin methylesterase-like acyl-CoA thioesterase